MLKYLNISNFAVIDRLEARFQEGLNLLTGETGSGKSIIVDSLSLLMGARSSALQVRTNERVATVEGLFEVGGERLRRVREVLAGAGVEIEDGTELLIRREIHSSGRSRIFVEDQSVTAATLRLLQPHLVAIHGQGEQRALLSQQSQVDLLDSYAGNTALRERVAETYGRWRKALEELTRLEEEMRERERAVDLLQYELNEIERLQPAPNEDEELATERKLLTHAEKLLELGAGAFTELYERDESILGRLVWVRRRLEELSEIDTKVAPLLELLEQSVTNLTDVAEALRSYGEGVEFSPARLAQIEARLSELERLKRKYNTDLEGIFKVQDELSSRLQRLSDLTEREAALKAELSVIEEAYRKVAEELTARRRKASESLGAAVMEDLRFVAMEKARFFVEVRTAEAPEARAQREALEGGGGGYYTPQGADVVEFFLSANPGEEPRPLSRVASGGELSRLMLTLRTVAMSRQPVRAGEGGTVVFDEIDVGIGGRVAEAVGRRLKALSAGRQVLCVTHQPQIARFASSHFVVSKRFEKERTTALIRELKGEDRVLEIARMIGGGEEGAQTTLETARWLLESASEGAAHGAVGRKRRAKEKIV